MVDIANRWKWTLALVVAGGFVSTTSVKAQDPSLQAGIINEHLRKAWADNKLTPAKPATDLEFMRRAFIDLIGRIPTADEIRDFERRKVSRKALIHRLLYEENYKVPQGDDPKNSATFDYSSEFAEHWANIWTVWTMTRGGSHETYHDQMNFWFRKQFNNKEINYAEMVKKLLTATGKTNTQQEVNFIMQHLGEPSPNDRRVSDGPFDSIPITSRVTRLFLGIQTQCTQCHDHPFNPEWGQENFWGVNAFFRQTTRSAPPSPPANLQKNKKDPALVQIEVTDSPSFNSSGRIYYERRSGVLMSIKPTFLPDLSDLEKDKAERTKKPIPSDSMKPRRQVLADYFVSHDNFGKAFINRTWAHFFGRGLNEQAAADDFGGHNKTIHPEMLEKLGQEFIKYKYDMKMAMEWICNSEAYSLSYQAANHDMTKPEYDVYFTRMPLKAMSPEVLFESLTTATKADKAVDKDARKEARARWMSRLVSNFGDDEGNEVTFNGTIVQALLMMNGRELNEEIRRSDGFVAKAMGRNKNEGSMINEIYLTALGRYPNSTLVINYESINPVTKKKVVEKTTEMAYVTKQLNAARNAGGGKGANTPLHQFYEDLFWSLLNTNEFMLNH